LEIAFRSQMPTSRTQKDSFRYFSLKRVRPTPEQLSAAMRRMAECKCCKAASF